MSETEVLEPEVIIPEVTRQDEVQALATRHSGQAQLALSLANDFQIVDDQAYINAGDLRLQFDRDRKKAEEILEAVTKPLYDHWKRLRGWFVPSVQLREDAAKILSNKRIAYERAKQAETSRILKEQQEAARKEQERLDKLALERAARAEAKGDTERAAEILETVPQVVIPVAPAEPVVTRVKGIAKQEYFWAVVSDLPALLTAVASGEVPQEAVTPNMPYLNKTAQALKHNLKWPGVTVKSEWREKGTGR